MNYIELINRFWRELGYQEFTPTEVTVYFRLLDISNSLGWKNPFTLSNTQATALMSISENTLTSARARLAQKGLIAIKVCNGKRKAPIYCLPEKIDDVWQFPSDFASTITSNFEAKVEVFNKHKTKLNSSSSNSEQEEILKFQAMADDAKTNCPIWLEQMAAKLKKTTNEICTMIDNGFRLHYITDAHPPHQSLRDFQSHFNRWATIQQQQSKQSKRHENQPSRTDKFERRRGFEPSLSQDPKDWGF